VIPFLAIFGGIALDAAWNSKAIPLKAFVALAFLAAATSALPVMRPWEYFNEAVGGAANGYRYFDDEGIDLSERTKEMARYYREVLQPGGEIPYIDYFTTLVVMRGRGLDCVGCDPRRDETKLMSMSPVTSGTILQDAKFMSRRLWWDAPALRAATPVARFGNLLVYRGTFALSGKQAAALYFAGVSKIFAEKPDLEKAELLLSQSAAIDPSAFFVNIQLGNLLLRRGSREEALRAYMAALDHAPNDPTLRQSIQKQIKRVSVEGLDQIPELRNPSLE
jgi:tetratricopeptide (TPR) repeat protein